MTATRRSLCPRSPFLGVLPGTGGLTRLVDKRKVRRDHADMFCTLAEGVRGPKAKAWNLIDDTWPKSKWDDKVAERSQAIVEATSARGSRGIQLNPVVAETRDNGFAYEYVEVVLDAERRTARLIVHGPRDEQPSDGAGYFERGDQSWALRCFRELDDALCHLRFEHEDLGLILLETRGDLDAILAVERTLAEQQDHWLIREITLFMARVCRRFDLMARSIFAVVGQDSAFGGSFLELAMGGDRIYMLDASEIEGSDVSMQIGPLSSGLLPMSNGLTRLQSRFPRRPRARSKARKGDAAPRRQGGLRTRSRHRASGRHRLG